MLGSELDEEFANRGPEPLVPGPTHPCAFIREIPISVHTITGVATAIAAFVGWAPKGSSNEAVLVRSWAEYQTRFGGLVPNIYLGYAVNQYFSNGGAQAYIVRIVDGAAAADSAHGAGFAIGGLTVYAKNPGDWGNSIWVSVSLSPADASRFSIAVQQSPASGGLPATIETWSNLSFNSSDPQGRYVVAVIEDESNYISFTNPGAFDVAPRAPTGSPAVLTPTQLANGRDGVVLLPNNGLFEKALNVGGVASAGGIPLLNGIFFNLLCVPGETTGAIISALQSFCQLPENRALYIVDSQSNSTFESMNAEGGPYGSDGMAITLRPQAANSAFYFPWIWAPDPLAGGQPTLFPPCGFMAGICAATDAGRGVWKAPAGSDAKLRGAIALALDLTEAQSDSLSVKAINCLRNFPGDGDVVWGARTLDGADALGSQWKYVPVRRMALFIEASLSQGVQWAVFEPNNETLWGQLRMAVGAFMQGLFRQGAFAGATPRQAYFVKCDTENNPQSSIDQGVVNVVVGFAPLQPAEFVVITIQQLAGLAA